MDTLARLGWRTSLEWDVRGRGCCGAVGLDLHDHLLAREQAVGDELASAQCDLGFSHDCGEREGESKVVVAVVLNLQMS